MNILITGASTGIGEACARWLDARGHRVFPGVRRTEDAARLRQGSSERLVPVILDVTDAGTIESAARQIETALGPQPLEGLVNNAGIAVAGPIEYVPVEGWRRQFETNVVGQVAVTQAFLPMIRRARGRIVFMGSIGGRMATPFLAPYCASKFALEAIVDSLRVELLPWGVHVAILEPGSIATPIWSKSDSAAAASLEGDDASSLQRDYGAAMEALRSAAAAAGQRGLPPQAVARVVERALTAPTPKTRYLVGRDARIQMVLKRIFPDRLRDHLLTRALKLPRQGTR
jgi:NAD(P)-dependent dehydrogenase (short-subunit alcohol dehydrogenase family)